MKKMVTRIVHVRKSLQALLLMLLVSGFSQVLCAQDRPYDTQNRKPRVTEKYTEYMKGITWEKRPDGITNQVAYSSIYTRSFWMEIYTFVIKVYERDNDGNWVMTQTIDRESTYSGKVIAENVYCNSKYNKVTVMVSNDTGTTRISFRDGSYDIQYFVIQNYRKQYNQYNRYNMRRR